MNKQGELPRSGKRRSPGGRLLSMFLSLCMIVTMLPATALAAAELATAVTVGGAVLNVGNRYATTNASGAVSLGGDEGTYNVKFDAATGTLTLRNANIKYESLTANAISATGHLTIVAVGTNAVTASGNSAAIYITTGNLKLKGDGALTAVSDQTLAVQASNITVEDSITLTAVGGATTAGQPGGDGLYAFNDLKIKGTARVTAVGGKSPASSPFSAGIRAGASVTIEESATVTAVGGDTRLGGYSAGISVYITGAITIGGSAKVVAVGGNGGTNASYGLYAHGAGGSITHTGGLLVAKGGKGDTSLAMNQLLGGDTMDGIAVTTEASAATNASKYCVVSPKISDTAVYHVVTEGVSKDTPHETTGHIEWSSDDLTLTNIIVLAPDVGEGASTALNMQGMPAGATLSLGGFNVLLAGYALGFSAAVNGSGSYSDLTITGDGDLTAISVDGGQCYGIVNAKELSPTGAITAIGGGTGSNYGISYSGNPLSISAGKVIAIAVGSGSTTSYGIYKGSLGGTLSISGGSGVAVGRNSALSAVPNTTGLVTMGVNTDKAMAWGPMPPPAAVSAAPTADTATVAKTAETQASVAFTLTNSPAYADGLTWTVYTAAIGDTLVDGITAANTGNALTLTHATDIPAGTYYISVTEAEKPESARLALTVGAYVATCHLTVNLNGGSGGTTSGDYAPGASVPIDAGTRAGYSFSGWTASLGSSPFADASSPSTTFTMPPNPVTITANWTYTGGGSSDSGGGSGGTAAPKYEAEVASGGSSGKTDMTVDIKKGSASAELSAKDLKNGTDFVVTMPNISGVTHYDLGLPVARLASASEKGSIRLSTDMGSVTLPANMLTGTDAASGNTARINIGTADASALANSARAAVGNRPVVTLSLSVDGKPANWSNPGAQVTVSIPYTPAKGEDQNAIVIWYIDGAGNLNCVTNGRYDPETGTVAFQTTHFSLYAVGYNDVTFTDVAAGAWHHSAVTYLAARGITSGTADTTFSPDATLTRGQFITMLLRAYGIEADAKDSDNFADAGNTYYTGYLAAAKRLGISDGVGDNRFAPGQAITRQEMFTLLYNALKVLNNLPKGDNGKTLADFTDSGNVASWAKEAMTVLVKSGTVSGSGGKLTPASGSTRAQMAQVLYNLLSK